MAEPHAKVEAYKKTPEYLRAQEFGEFFESLLIAAEQLRTLQAELGVDSADVMASFWTFGSSQSELNRINPTTNNQRAARTELKTVLEEAGPFYQSVEMKNRDEGIAKLRAICDELFAVYARLETLLSNQPQPVDFTLDEVTTVFTEAQHLKGQIRKDVLAAAALIGQPFKDEIEKVLALRTQLDTLQ